ncbi:MAG: AAA family ATPase [Planctomycetota bacterium]
MRTIAIINQKGGCGKTTTAINLAAVFGEQCHRTLLIDLDPQSHCAAGLAIPEDKIDQDISDALLHNDSTPLDARRYLWRVTRNLDLLPSRTKLAGLEAARGGLADVDEPERRLAGALEKLGVHDTYDVCIIDCPPSIGLLTYNALAAARELIVPVDTSYFSLLGARKQVRTVRSVGRRIGMRHDPRLLATLHNTESALARDLLDELRDQFADAVIPGCIRMDQHLPEAASFGRPVIEYAPLSTAAEDYRSLGEWVLGRSDTQRTGDLPDGIQTAEDAAEIGISPAAVRRFVGRGNAPLPSPSPHTEFPPAPTPRQMPASHPSERSSQYPAHQPAPGTQPLPAAAARSTAVADGTGTAPGVAARVPAESMHAMGTTAAAPISRAEEITRRAARMRAEVLATQQARSARTATLAVPAETIEDTPRVTAVQGALRVVDGPAADPSAEPVTEPETGPATNGAPATAPTKSESVERLYGSRAAGRRILFVQPLELGDRVCVAGSFNEWDPHRHWMRRNDELGIHELAVDVEPGVHEYRLVVDGVWVDDPYAARTSNNEYGGNNAIVLVMPAST